MDILFISRQEVKRLLNMADCMEAMFGALTGLHKKEADCPQRLVMPLPQGHGVLASMPAYDAGSQYMGAKLISVIPGNHQTPYESHQGFFALFESGFGRPRAVMDASEITAMRTAAVSGLATRMLARQDASDLMLIGCGVQARQHLEAICLERPIRRVRAWDLHPEAARAFADWAKERFGFETEVQEGPEPDTLGAHIICTLTPATEPVLKGADVSPGAHINAVGACTPNARELDTRAVVQASLFVDRKQAVVCEAGDYLIPCREGAIGEEHIKGELGGLLLGRVPGRGSYDEITLFESLGLAVEDLAAASLVYNKAMEQGLGHKVSM